MLSSGFADAPVSRSLVIGVIATSLLVSILDIKHDFYILIEPHLWTYHQLWRVFVFQFCYTNSTEVLFAAITFYNMRVIERLWGSRKYLSFILISYAVTTLIPPLLVAVILRPLSFHTINYIPAGPTAIIFSLLAQYNATIPHVYKYRIATSTAAPTHEPFSGVTFSDKSYVYLPALQLSLSQSPGSTLCALVGWIVGHAWRNEVLPASVVRWRLPGWMMGMSKEKRADDFEGLRRRLATEDSAAASSTGTDGQHAEDAGRRRTIGRQLLDQFRGAF